MAVGRDFSFILSPSTEKVIATGSNRYGQLGISNSVEKADKLTVVGLPDEQVVGVAAGAFHSLFVMASGRVFAAGRNHHGQLGFDNGLQQSSEVVEVCKTCPGGFDVTAVAAGYSHSVFLLRSGSVAVTGLNSVGQLGLGTLVSRTTPLVVEGLPSIKGVAAGFDVSYFLTSTGEVWSTGQNLAGQLGIGSTRSQSTPQKMIINGGIEIVEIAAGESHCILRTVSGSLQGTGANFDGQLDTAAPDQVLQPIILQRAFTNTQEAGSIAAGGDGSCYIELDSGDLYAFGSNRDGQLGLGSLATTQGLLPQQVTDPWENATWTSAALGEAHAMLLTDDGRVLATGRNNLWQLGSMDLPDPIRSPADVYSHPELTTTAGPGPTSTGTEEDTTTKEPSSAPGPEQPGPGLGANSARNVWLVSMAISAAFITVIFCYQRRYPPEEGEEFSVDNRASIVEVDNGEIRL